MCYLSRKRMNDFEGGASGSEGSVIDHNVPKWWSLSLSRWLSSKESTCQCRRREFDPWLGKIPWRREWQPTPVLAWEIPWTEEPGRLQSMGLQRIGHDLETIQQEWNMTCWVLKLFGDLFLLPFSPFWNDKVCNFYPMLVLPLSLEVITCFLVSQVGRKFAPWGIPIVSLVPYLDKIDDEILDFSWCWNGWNFGGCWGGVVFGMFGWTWI